MVLDAGTGKGSTATAIKTCSKESSTAAVGTVMENILTRE